MSEHCTVVIPAFNTAAYIGKTLQSVLDQDYPNFDIVVVDDASTDATHRMVLDLMPGRSISLIRLRKWQGVTAATACGIAHAKGPIITIVDSDDMVFKNSLSVGMHAFRDDAVGFVWTKFRLSSGRKGWSGPLPPGKTMNEALRGGWWRASHQRFFRKQYYSASPGFDLSVDRSSDFHLCFLLSLTGCKCVYVPIETYWYRCSRPGSITKQGSAKQKLAVRKIIERFT